MFEFDFGLGEDLDLLRDTVRSFAADRIAPRAADIDERNEFPRDLWPELGELGLLGMTLFIQLAVFPTWEHWWNPAAWWAVVLFAVFARGPGLFSLDRLLGLEKGPRQ